MTLQEFNRNIPRKSWESWIHFQRLLRFNNNLNKHIEFLVGIYPERLRVNDLATDSGNTTKENVIENLKGFLKDRKNPYSNTTRMGMAI